MNILAQLTAPPARAGRWTAPGTQRLVLHNVPWQSYVVIGDALPDRPALRMTYDRGNLEFMTTSPEHEKYKVRLGRLLEALVEECGLRVEPLGNMTMRREELERGLEPDECFWIANEPHMRARLDWDPRRDPPPDLVIEIEISRSALDRMGIYAALRVPEVCALRRHDPSGESAATGRLLAGVRNQPDVPEGPVGRDRAVPATQRVGGLPQHDPRVPRVGPGAAGPALSFFDAVNV